MKVLATALSLILAAAPALAEEYHVSIAGHDTNPGTEVETFRTISAAALIAEPGDTVTVHEGVYRERINPPSFLVSAIPQRIKLRTVQNVIINPN